MWLSRIWIVVQWVIAAFIMLVAICALTIKGGMISCIFFFLLAILISPLRNSIFKKLPERFQKKGIAIASGIALTIASLFTFPTAGQVKTPNEATEVVVERSVTTNEDNIKATVNANDEKIAEDNKEIEQAKTEKETKAEENNKSEEKTTKEDNIKSDNKTTEEENIKSDNKTAKEENNKSDNKTKEENNKSESEKKVAQENKKDEGKKATEQEKTQEKATTENKSSTEKTPQDNSNEAKESSPTEEVTQASETVTDQPQTNSNTENVSGGDTGTVSTDSNDSNVTPDQQQNTEVTYVLNTNTHKFHCQSCKDVQRIKPENYATSSESRDELIAQGYEPCGHCNP